MLAVIAAGMVHFAYRFPIQAESRYVQVTYATEAAPGGINEDHVIAGPQWVAVLDGATPRPDVDSGCIHGVSWLVQRWSASLARRLVLSPTMALTEVVADAITEVRAVHEQTCDLRNPDSPSSTIVVLRQSSDTIDYLLLGDSPLVLDADGDLQVIIDERLAHLPSYTSESVRAHRNQPHGFWVMSTAPEAADHALTGSIPSVRVSRAALLSDGASRYVELFSLGKWNELVNMLDEHGPAELIRRVRTAEQALPLKSSTPDGRRIKRHDDATAALVKL